MEDKKQELIKITIEAAKEARGVIDWLEMFLAEEPRDDDQKLHAYEHAVSELELLITIADNLKYALAKDEDVKASE